MWTIIFLLVLGFAGGVLAYYLACVMFALLPIEITYTDKPRVEDALFLVGIQAILSAVDCLILTFVIGLIFKLFNASIPLEIFWGALLGTGVCLVRRFLVAMRWYDGRLGRGVANLVRKLRRSN